MSATIQLSGAESESWVCKAKSGWKVGAQSIDRGNREYQVNKGNWNIQESMRENEK